MKRRRLRVVAGVLHARREPVERGRDLVVVRSEDGLEGRQDVPQRLLRLAMLAASVEDRGQRTTVRRHLEVGRTDVHVAGFGHVPTMHHAGRDAVEASLHRASTAFGPACVTVARQPTNGGPHVLCTTQDGALGGSR